MLSKMKVVFILVIVFGIKEVVKLRNIKIECNFFVYIRLSI